MSDGSVVDVDYSGNGSSMVANYSRDLREGEKPVVTQDLGECLFSSVGATGAILGMGATILSGGTALAIGGAALAAGGASGLTGYVCGKAAKGN